MKRVACVACVLGLVLTAGCVTESKYKALLAQNQIQSAKIKGLQRDLDQSNTDLASLRSQLATLTAASDSSRNLLTAKGSQIDVLKRRNADLEARIADLVKAIADNAGRIDVGPPISEEVRDALKDLARDEPSLEFDPETGTCKFASDVVFASGSDTVKPAAAAVLRKFAAIFTGVGKGLHLRVEGHTDDQRIAKAATKAQHPTNWHLSAHRAISVVRVLYQAGIEQDRMSAAGFGRWRPLAPNTSAANRAKNRRVEIYVARGPAGSGVKTVSSGTTVMGGE